MSVVRVLPDQVVNQIAAGEVVERPASVIKELVENSLDAGASRVEVQLVGGGAERIRITDDGVGMDREDAMMCLERHATSKIGSAEDLEHIGSLGFRGEAIPSIASVSRFALLTRPADLEEGVRIKVEGGEIASVRAAGCAPGTEIDVRDLFFNIPARRKFLRTRATELAHSTEAVVRMALARPDVAFRMTSDGRVVLAGEVADRATRARQVLGPDAARLAEVAFERGGLAVEGLVSPLAVHRPSGKALYLYVNGRYVRDAVVRRAIADAYRDRIPRGRQPLVVLHIRIDPALVDVNVHPAKTEVRFRDPRHVQEMLAEGVRDALRLQGIERQLSSPGANRRPRWSEEVAPPLPLTPAKPPLPAHPDDDPLLLLVPRAIVEAAPVEVPEPPAKTVEVPPERPARPVLDATEPGPVPPAAAASAAYVEPAATAIPVAAEPGDWAPSDSSIRALRPVGPFGRKWFLLEGDGELVVVDHALGDELLARRRLERGSLSQRLLVPSRQRLAAAEVVALAKRAEALGALGLEVVEMSPTELAIRAVPQALPRLHVDGLLEKLARCPEDALSATLASAQTPPPVPDPRAVKAMLASLEEAGLDAVVARWPAPALVKGP
ncbi:MAG: DNA mismatch repair endonuclease MutL [Alphaproteobacteria bacterium]|nr:DNA mismatch repair endonuclease MutL [Alphaproteobacteria bacterium]